MTAQVSSTSGSGNLGIFNSVQLNLVLFVNVAKANLQDSLDGCVFMMDNSVGSVGQGTDHLETRSKQGMVLNWIIYAMDADKGPDGTFPPSVRINNIVFLDDNGEDVEDFRVCQRLAIIGGPDKVRSKYTAVWYYWAGTVRPDLPVGRYKYRLVLDLDTADPTKQRYLNLNTLALNVIPVEEETIL